MKKLLILPLLLITTASIAPTISEEEIDFHNNSILYIIEEEKRNDELEKFIDHLAIRESSNNWKAVNDINCIGLFQFHENTLAKIGYGHITADLFKSDTSIFPPELQRECVKILIKVNSIDLRKYSDYFGTMIDSTLITKSGLLAGMHLGGLQAIKDFLESSGSINRTDAYGTSISDYINEFNTYEL